MKINLEELRRACPQAWNDLLQAGRLAGGHLLIEDEAARVILGRCPEIKPGDLVGKQELTGAGDLVALVAQPVAKAVDAVLGTKLSTCTPCKKRQDALNRVLPLK